MTSDAPFDLIVAGGRVIDPANGIDSVCDVGVRDGLVAAVAAGLPRGSAKIVDAAGAIVTPGLVDIHTHVYAGATSLGVEPDPIARRSCVTTLVDAGSAGAGNIAGLRRFARDHASFRLLAFVNISFPGIFAFDSAVSLGEASIPELLHVGRCVEAIEANRDFAVGVKVRMGVGTSGKTGLLALERARDAAERVNLPVMVHVGAPPPSYAEILGLMRRGDILTHCFRPAPNAPVDDKGCVLAALHEARARGVLFDIGHGKGSFGFASVEAALADGFLPDMISSDVHAMSIDGPAFDLLHTMSKMLCCGLRLEDAVAMVTSAPAQALGRADIGHLGPGAIADIAVLDLAEVRIPFVDVIGVKREGMFALRPKALISGGRIETPGPRPFEQAA